jgi:hypothetical protein
MSMRSTLASAEDRQRSFVGSRPALRVYRLLPLAQVEAGNRDGSPATPVSTNAALIAEDPTTKAKYFTDRVLVTRSVNGKFEFETIPVPGGTGGTAAQRKSNADSFKTLARSKKGKMWTFKGKKYDLRGETSYVYMSLKAVYFSPVSSRPFGRQP